MEDLKIKWLSFLGDCIQNEMDIDTPKDTRKKNVKRLKGGEISL